jgi:PAS domain S-box-containing protein
MINKLMKKLPNQFYLGMLRTIALTAIVVGMLVLFGWVYDLAVLKSIIPGANTMKVNTALCFLSSGLSIMLYVAPPQIVQSKKLYTSIGKICASFTFIVGLLTLCEHLFNQDYGIDELLIRGEPDWRTRSPGRMSLMTALCFSLIGLNMLVGKSSNPIIQRIVKFSAFIILAIASFALVGYLYHPEALHKISIISSMALHTALLFFMFAIALMLVNPRLRVESWHYGLAAIVVLVEFGLHLKLTAWFGAGLDLFIIFLPGIIFIALLAGFGPGLFTTALSAMVVAVWIYEPVGLIQVELLANQVSLAIFCVLGTMISAVIRLSLLNQKKAAAFDSEQAIREIRREAMFLGGILETSSQPFAVGYPDGRLGLTNHAYEELTGYSKVELQQLDWSNILTPSEWRANEEEMIAGLINTGNPIRYEKEYIRKDGSRVPVELLAHLVRDAEGQPDYYYAFITDVSERKRAEEALRDSEEYFRIMFERSSVGKVITDPITGRFLKVNKAYCELTGYTEAELLQRTFMEITDPRDREDDIKLKDQFIKGIVPAFERDKRYVRPDGSLVWAHVTLNLIRNGVGEPIRMVGVMQNISERKRIEAALREREHRLNAIIDYSPSALSLKHPNGRYALANPNLQRIHNLSEAQIIGKTDFDLYPEAIARVFQANDRQVLETMTRHSIEETIPVADVHRVYRTHLFPVLDDAGEAEYICRISLDITDLKRAEDELRESEYRFRQLIESLPQMIWTCCADGSCDYLSPQWCKYTGIPEKPQLGIGWLERLHPEDRAQTISTWQSTIENGTEFITEYRIRRYDGEYRWFHTIAVPLHDETGAIVKWFGSNTDIQGLKEAELSVRESEEQLYFALDRIRLATETTGVGIWEWNINTNKVMWDPQMFRLYGVDPTLDGFVDYATWSENVLPEDLPEQEKQMHYTIQHQGTNSREFRILRANDKACRHIHAVETTRTNVQGQVEWIVGTNFDVTESKSATAKLQASYHEKEVLLKEVYHRVKNNLQVVSSLINLQARSVKNEEAMGLLKQSAGRIKAMALVHEKLYQATDLAKIDFGDYIGSLVGSLLYSFGITSNQVKLSTDIKGILLGIDRAIPCGLIINEVLSNALKYAFPSGQQGKIDISFTHDQNEYKLVISDNGIGLPDGFDINKSKTLGLQLVAGLTTNQLKGQISIDKINGTSITVQFPYDEPLTNRLNTDLSSDQLT